MNIRNRLTAGFAATAAVGAISFHAAAATAYEENWPQWRGPTGNGVALRGSPPVEWSESRNVKWKRAIPGSGHATPIIWGDRIFVLTAVPSDSPSVAPPPAAAGAEDPPERRARPGEGRGRGRGRGGFGGGERPTTEYAFTVFCLGRQTGEVRWERVSRREVPHEGHQRSNTYSSGSPVTDGEHLVAFFGSRGLYCYDLDGKLVWEKDLGDMRTRNGFGEGTSPALHNGVVLVLWDTEGESFLYAFDKRTGRELWKRPREEKTGWTTPYVLEHGGRTQAVVNATGAVRSYDLATGEVLWECAGQTENAIPSVVADGQTVYAMSGYRGNAALAIALGRSGDLTGSEAIRWQVNRGTPYVPSPLLYDGWLYFCQRTEGLLTCLDAKTGAVQYGQERLEGLTGVYASPVGAAGRVYLPGQNGTTLVLAAGPELKVLARNALEDSFDASPAVVGNELFLRGHRNLYCIAE